jgi:hypothetical protein
VRRIAARQVRIGIRITQVVEGDNVKLTDTARLMNCAHDIAPDTAVTIDANLDRHFYFSR